MAKMADVASAPAARSTRRAGGVLLALALLLVATNLRPAVVSVATLVDQIRGEFGASATELGLLTTLPVLCFGLLAPVTPRLSRRLGLEPLVGVALVVLLAGVLLRLVPAFGVVLVGSVLVGCAVGVGNVVMPVLVKRDFPHRTGLMTGAYSAILSAGGAVAAAATVPIQRALGTGWAPALALWGVLAVLALVVWSPTALALRRRHETSAGVARAGGVSGLWTSPLAWAVTLYMGLQSLHFYAVTAWVPTLFVDAGLGRSEAGLLLGLSGVFGLVASALTPLLATRLRRQSALVAVLALLYVVGYGGLLLAPATGAVLWMALLGTVQGANLAVALLLITLRSPDAAHTTQLSGMAQGVGYCLAALGPLALGALHDATGGWSVPLVVMVVLVVPTVVAGVLAGRDRHVRSPDAGALP